MRNLLAGVLGLALLAPVWADDKADEAPKTPTEKLADLQKGFRQELTKLGEEYKSAKTAEERAKIEEKAFKFVAGDYARKMLALANDNPKSPVAVEALVWVCTQGYRTTLVPDALGRLLKDHADSEQLGEACGGLQQRPDGEKLLREVRLRATNKAVKFQAGLALADLLRDTNDLAASQEAEKLLEQLVAQSEGMPVRGKAMAEDNLKDIRVFGVGKPAPAAESKDLDDKAVSLADLKGKVVVLDFWATWCGPCKGMIPHERELVKKHAGKPFVFVSISADEKAEKVKDFVAKEPMPWTHWFSGPMGEPVKGWNIHGFPTLYIIDTKGVIRGRFVGAGPETEEKLGALIDKLVKEAGGKGA
jgi:thiol-disulfide isomerase/thioredoxin